MDKIEGMAEAFARARVVFLTTFKGKEERSRQMTNFNENPYEIIWFPTEEGTRKVQDIAKNPRVLVTFPAGKEGVFYEIEGEASMEDRDVVEQKWRWWYLYWRPSQSRRFWFGPLSAPKRAIINVKPIKARLLSES